MRTCNRLELHFQQGAQACDFGGGEVDGAARRTGAGFGAAAAGGFLGITFAAGDGPAGALFRRATVDPRPRRAIRRAIAGKMRAFRRIR